MVPLLLALEAFNTDLVLGVYGALQEGDVLAAQASLGADLDWWFHGPRTSTVCDVRRLQILLLLIDERAAEWSRSFKPLEVGAGGDKVFVEGTASAASTQRPSAAVAFTWVHIWTVSAEGHITGLREYVNTAVSATSATSAHAVAVAGRPGLVGGAGGKGLPSLVWESKLWREKDNAAPGFILSI